MAKIAERSQQLVRDFLERQASDPERRRVVTPEAFDPLNVGGAFLEMTRQMMANPARLVQAQVSLWQDYMALWQNATRRFLGGENKPVIGPEIGRTSGRERRCPSGSVAVVAGLLKKKTKNITI